MDVTSSIRRGVVAGRRIGGLANNTDVAQESADRYRFKQTYDAVLKNAIGITVGKDGEVEYSPMWENFTPAERAIGLKNYQANERKALAETFENASKFVNLYNSAYDTLVKFKDKENGLTKGGQEVLATQFYQNLQGFLKSGIDNEGADKILKNLNIDGMAKNIQNSQDLKEFKETVDLNLGLELIGRYKKTRDGGTIGTYRALYANNPDFFKEKGLPNPDNLEKDYMSNTTFKIQQERKAAEQEQSERIKKKFERKEQGKGMFSTFTAGENDQYGYPKGTVYQVDPETGQHVIKHSPPPPVKFTEKERDVNRRVSALPKIRKLDPEEAYRRGWKMNDDGTVFTELDTNAPVKLPSFDKKMGKRGAVKSAKLLGEAWDDAKEIQDLLADKNVQRDMVAVKNAGMWMQIVGKTKNQIRSALQKRGFTYGGDKTIEALIRISKMAAEERKEKLGSAVTNTELKSVKPYLPDIGDTFELLLQKIDVFASEAEEQFTRWLDMYKDQANMSPFYNAFGMKRFGGSGTTQDALDMADKYIQEAKGK